MNEVVAKTVFYRHVPHHDDVLVFADADDATHVDRVWHAVNTAKTWGELKRLLPPDEFEDEGFEDFDMADDEPFEPTILTGDGDYPDWLQARMEKVLPRDLLERFGEYLESVFNGPFWSIPSRFENDIVTELTKRGYRVSRRDDLNFF